MSDILVTEYTERFEQALNPIAANLETFLNEILDGVPRIDRVSARAKTVERFLAKSEKKLDSGESKYTDPINQIQDQIGARVVAFYKADLDAVSARLNEYLRPIETQDVFPESEWEFGYFGRHYIFLLPKDVIPKGGAKRNHTSLF